MGKTYVMGDCHGGYKALLQCLERSNFNYETDTLIQLGDICDGWSEVYECVEELLSIKNLICIRGNHDKWFQEWIDYGLHPVTWLQGGEGTLDSYIRNSKREISKFHRMGGISTNLTFIDIPESHIKFFRNQENYYIDDKNRCFVHGGFNRHQLINEQDPFIYYWDRDLWMTALSYEGILQNINKEKPVYFKTKDKFKEIYIGHTSTISWGTDKPMKAANIWNLDTGCGFGNGKLTIMNVDTKEYFQSDLVKELYPNERGRN